MRKSSPTSQAVFGSEPRLPRLQSKLLVDGGGDRSSYELRRCDALSRARSGACAVLLMVRLRRLVPMGLLWAARGRRTDGVSCH